MADSSISYPWKAIRDVFRVPAQGAKPEIVIDLKGFLMTGLFGVYFTLVPADEPQTVEPQS
jgi:hypothetical protein